MSRKLVSVVTGTWQRHELLAEAIENVRAQTYRPLEHVIVSDGEDIDLEILVRDSIYHHTMAVDGFDQVPLTFVELGFNSSTLLPDSFGAGPLVVGQLLARGEYQTWLADDERMEPDHIASLVEALETEGADFAYGRVRMWWVGRSPEQGWDIGASPPSCGQITNVLYRTELLKRGLYPFGAGMTSDWVCISQWVNAGARHAFVGRVTFSHRADH